MEHDFFYWICTKVQEYIGIYRMFQEESSIFREIIGSVILSKSVYVHVSYSELFHCTVHCTDEKHAMTSHELQSALMLTVEF
jgi:hypothetical protein